MYLFMQISFIILLKDSKDGYGKNWLIQKEGQCNVSFYLFYTKYVSDMQINLIIILLV